MTRAERLAALADLANYRSADLVRIVGRIEHATALISWIREEAAEAATDEQFVAGCEAGGVSPKLVAAFVLLGLGLLLGLVPVIEGLM